MRLSVWLLTLLLLTVAVSFPASASPPHPSGATGWHIYYRVLNSRTHGAVPGAEVQEYQPSCPVIGTVRLCRLFPTYVNQSGVAMALASGSNNEIPNGTYEIVTNASGFFNIPDSFANVTINGADVVVTLLLGQTGSQPLYTVEYHVVDYFKRTNVAAMFCEGVVNQLPLYYPCHTYTDAGGTYTNLVPPGEAWMGGVVFVNATGYHNLTSIQAVAVTDNENITLALIWSNATQYSYTVTVLDRSTHAPISNASVVLCGSSCVTGAWLALTGPTGNATILVYNVVSYSTLFVTDNNYQQVTISPIGHIQSNVNVTVYLNSTSSGGLGTLIFSLTQNPLFYLAIAGIGILAGAILIYRGRRKKKRRRTSKKRSTPA